MTGSEGDIRADAVDEDPSPLGAAPTLPVADRRDRKKARRDSRRAHEAESRLRQPVAALEGGSGVVNVYEPRARSSSSVGTYLRDLWGRRQFLVALARSDLRGSRSSTVLGSIWGLLDPIFQAAIYYFLFVVIRGGMGRPEEFLPLLVGGIFLFRVTAAALTDGGKSIRRSKALILNSNFPRAILPLASVHRGVLGFLPSIVVFAGVYLWLGSTPHGGLWWLPVLFGIQMVLGVGLALMMATLVVFFKDAENALTYVQRILFFTTPVIYPVAVLPDHIRSVLSFQPLFPLFANYQLVLDGGTVDRTLVFHAVCWAGGFVVVGGWLFLRHEQSMAARL